MWLTKYLELYRSPENEGGAEEDAAQVEALLDFNFEAPEAQEGDQRKQESKAEEGTEADKPKPAKTAEPPAPADEPADKAVDLEAKALQEQVRQLQATVEQLRTQKPEPAKPEPPPAGEPDYVTEYKKIAVPVELVSKIQSEDPVEAQATLSGIIQSVLIRAAADTRRYVDDNLGRLRGEVPELATSTIQQQQQAERIQRDFFDTYKVLDKPLLKPVVIQTMYQYGMELQQRGVSPAWNEEFKNEVARRVITGLGGTFGKPNGTAPQPTPTPKPKPKEQFSAGSSVRAGTKDQGNEFMDALGIQT